MSKLVRQVLYWTVTLPLLSLLCLEMALQLASLVNQHLLANPVQPSFLTSHLRVVTMGDSNTYGLYLKPEESYPKQLETWWNSRHPRKMEVINLGYPGSNSSRIVSNLPDVIETFSPDIVLIMIGTNDSWTATIPQAGNSRKLIDWIKQHSRSYRLFCLITRQELDSAKLETLSLSDARYAGHTDLPAEIRYGEKHFEFSMQLRQPDDKSDPHLAYQKNIETLMETGKTHGTRIVFLTYPADKHYYKQANKLLKEMMEKHDYRDFIDTTTTFATLQPPKGEGNDYFFQDLHATAKGNALLSQATAEQLAILINIQ